MYNYCSDVLGRIFAVIRLGARTLEFLSLCNKIRSDSVTVTVIPVSAHLQAIIPVISAFLLCVCMCAGVVWCVALIRSQCRTEEHLMFVSVT
jgi:hypothetical protein